MFMQAVGRHNGLALKEALINFQGVGRHVKTDGGVFTLQQIRLRPDDRVWQLWPCGVFTRCGKQAFLRAFAGVLSGVGVAHQRFNGLR